MARHIKWLVNKHDSDLFRLGDKMRDAGLEFATLPTSGPTTLIVDGICAGYTMDSIEYTIDHIIKENKEELRQEDKEQTMTLRSEVYRAIDSERRYQMQRWHPQGCGSDVDAVHSLDEWILYCQDYLAEAAHLASRTPKEEKLALPIMRKVAGMCVACMEQHGAPMREEQVEWGRKKAMINDKQLDERLVKSLKEGMKRGRMSLLIIPDEDYRSTDIGKVANADVVITQSGKIIKNRIDGIKYREKP